MERPSFLPISREAVQFFYQDEDAPFKISYFVRQHFLQSDWSIREGIILCIGTDRSTGDALGPMVGTKMKERLPDIPIFGTLEEPVHALNLEETVQKMKRIYQNPYIIAIDASLGRLKSVGMITVATGPLKPGAGVRKELMPIGDIHLTGIVNIGGFMEYFVLQNTRLSLVMKMAETISAGLYDAFIQGNVSFSPPKMQQSRARV